MTEIAFPWTNSFVLLKLNNMQDVYNFTLKFESGLKTARLFNMENWVFAYTYYYGKMESIEVAVCWCISVVVIWCRLKWKWRCGPPGIGSSFLKTLYKFSKPCEVSYVQSFVLVIIMIEFELCSIIHIASLSPFQRFLKGYCLLPFHFDL